MNAGLIIRWLIAIGLAAGLHLIVLNLFPDRRHVVMVAGGSLQVQLGMNSVQSVSNPEGATDTDELEEEVPEEEIAPPPEPEESPPVETPQETIPVAQPVPEPEPAPEESLIPVEDEVVPQPESVEEARPPQPELVGPDMNQVSESAETQQETPHDVLDNAASPPGSVASPSLSAESDSGGPTAASLGNATSDNYAGVVQRHLFRVRRPRSSGPGSAMVSFTVAFDGSLERAEIATSSRSRRFDRDALRMVERAAPFPAPPPGVNRDFVIEIEGE